MVNVYRIRTLTFLFLITVSSGINGEPCSEETPDDGWMSGGPELDDYCYLIIDQAMSWQESNDHCLHHGGQLASVHSGIEDGFLQGDYWIGLIKIQPGGQRHWTDGTSYDYNNWGDGEPNDFGGYEDCASIRKDDGKWNDESCSNSHGFVCKKWKQGHEPTDSPPTEIPPGHCNQENGDNKLTEFQGHCYKFVHLEEGSTVTWDEGIIKCEELGNGYKLASVHTERESAFIYTMLGQLPPSSQRTEIWIGANDRDDRSEEGKWRNMDESAFDYTHWATGEPNGSPSLDEDCASVYNVLHPGGEINEDPGKWNDASCDVFKGVLCKSLANPEIENPPQLETCEDEGKPEYLRYNGGCYRWVQEAKNWKDAEQDCNQQGAHLVSIWDDLEQAYTFTNVISVQSWIGLKKEPNEDEYRWSDSTYLSYYNWLRHQNMSSSEERCAYMDTAIFDCTDSCEYPDGNWIVTSCTDTYPYMCKSKKDDRKFCPEVNGDMDRPWEYYQENCYKLFGVDAINWQYKEERSFDEARQFCKSKGGDLMSVGSQEENDVVLPIVIPQGGYIQKSVWIGLQRGIDALGDEYPTDYQWMDGTETDYQHFAESYPNSNDGRDACIMTDPYTSNYDWLNSRCELRRPYICEIAARANPTTIQPPTLPPDVPCHSESPEDGWILHTKDQGGSGEYCYNFNTVDYKSWTEADEMCKIQGARMVSIHSEQENIFLTRKLFTQGQWALSWIGLQRDSLTGQFMWVDDGTYPDYLSWAFGEPNDADDMESCTTLIGEAGLWNDESCYGVHSYICKKRKDGDWPTPTPTTIPTGHCAEGFIEFQGYCYKMMGFDKTTDILPTDWYSAKDRCRDELNAELASIHSSREAAKITTMLVLQPSDADLIWFGAHEHNQGIWWWSDESRWDFTNWAFGEPNDMDLMEFNCGTIILDSGMWDDSNCTANYGYVCKVPASPENPNPPATPPCKDVNHQDYSNFNRFCYKWIDEPKSWGDAESFCNAQNSHLISVIDLFEQAYVFTEVNENVAWIGLNNKKNHDLFTWSDGWPANYINWGHEDNSRNELCAQINVTNDGKWDAVSCDSKLPFMCKFSTETPPPPNPKGQCPNSFDDLAHDSDYCYRIKADSAETDGKSWGDANTECIAQGGSLASIHSDHVQDAIYNSIKNKALDAWIGLQANNHHQWNWIDYTAYDYNHWNDGEPNSNDDSRYCGYVYKDNGFWDDTQCYGVYKGYVCQKERITPDVSSTVPPPTGTSSVAMVNQESVTTVLLCLVMLLV